MVTLVENSNGFVVFSPRFRGAFMRLSWGCCGPWVVRGVPIGLPWTHELPWCFGGVALGLTSMGLPWDFCRTSMGPRGLRDASVDEYSHGTLMGIPQDYIFRTNPIVLPWDVLGASVVLPWDCHVTSVGPTKVSWCSHGTSMGIPWGVHEMGRGLPWKAHGTPVGLSGCFRGTSMGLP